MTDVTEYMAISLIKSSPAKLYFNKWLKAHSCHTGVFTTSVASLAGTKIKFSSTILPVNAVGSNADGSYTLSTNEKDMTITTKGDCASTYFGDDKVHLLPVIFRKSL